MIKKLLFILFSVTVISSNLYAQDKYVVFMDRNGERVTDRMQAVSYSFIQKLQDSAWFVKEFDMRDTILSSGYYKDGKLTIPTGKFIYYEKKQPLTGFAGINVDTMNHIKISGYFLNGKKNGVWREYENGRLQYLKTYINDKLDGLYQNFSMAGDGVVFEGYYVNGHKEGDWCTLGSDGFADRVEVYNKKGVVVKKYNYVLSDFRAPEMPYNLGTYMKRKTENYVFKRSTGKIVVSFVVTKEGSITNPKVVTSFDQELDDLVVDALTSSAKWKPAFAKGQNINCNFTITLNIYESSLNLGNPANLHKKYNLQTVSYQ